MSEKEKHSTEYRKRSPGKTNERVNFRPVKLVLAATLLIGVVFYCAGGLGVYKSSPDNKGEIAEARSVLEELDKKELPEIQQAGPVRNTQEVDISSLQAELLDHYGEYDYNSENFRRWFQDAAIVGDSVAEAIRGFEWLNDINIQSQIGISLYSCEEVIAGTELLQPATIFLTFSANDIKSYTEYVDSFIRDYSDVINRLKNSVPQAEIYVQGILPCAPEFMDEYWYYEYLDDYNAAIERMCTDLGVHYYCMNFVLDAHPDGFNEDGIHPAWPYYPLWLTYMANVAGLNIEE